MVNLYPMCEKLFPGRDFSHGNKEGGQTFIDGFMSGTHKKAPCERQGAFHSESIAHLEYVT